MKIKVFNKLDEEKINKFLSGDIIVKVANISERSAIYHYEENSDSVFTSKNDMIERIKAMIAKMEGDYLTYELMYRDAMRRQIIRKGGTGKQDQANAEALQAKQARDNLVAQIQEAKRLIDEIKNDKILLEYK